MQLLFRKWTLEILVVLYSCYISWTCFSVFNTKSFLNSHDFRFSNFKLILWTHVFVTSLKTFVKMAKRNGKKKLVVYLGFPLYSKLQLSELGAHFRKLTLRLFCMRPWHSLTFADSPACPNGRTHQKMGARRACLPQPASVPARWQPRRPPRRRE